MESASGMQVKRHAIFFGEVISDLPQNKKKANKKAQAKKQPFFFSSEE